MGGFHKERKGKAILPGEKKVAVITRWPYYWGGRKAEFHYISKNTCNY